MTKPAPLSNARWLNAPRLVRIEGLPTGWATSPEHLSTLLGQPWRFVTLTSHAVGGVLEGDTAAAIAELGKLTSALDELITVEVREDIAVLVGESGDRQWVAEACTHTKPLAAFVAGDEIALAIEGWQQPSFQAWAS